MAESSRNNSTRLSSFSARRSENPFVTEISKRIATDAVRNTSARDINSLKKYVLMVVNGMANGDKMAILREYGGDVNAKDINGAVVETLIINMSPSDLNSLISDAKRSSQQLGTTVSKIRRDKKRKASFGTRNFEDKYEDMAIRSRLRSGT
jgi:hypothetical protein